MTPDSGSGTCLTYDIVHEANMIKRLVGYVPQIFSLYKDLTVNENLEFIARIYQVSAVRQRVQQCMEELELNPFKNILAGRLSGGWKQRLSLAAALIHDPKLLLLDEPTAGVDPKARREFWNYISYLTTQGITALVSTHYMDEAERCHRLAYIVYGHLMVEGTVSEIIDKVKLLTYAVKGKGLATLAEELRKDSAIEQVTAWGNELRICSQDWNYLQQISQRYADFNWNKVQTSLEEVFIHLVNQRIREQVSG
jgi:ABC-2 type transport system ATP-binding protein